jgi:hypothetical protein
MSDDVLFHMTVRLQHAYGRWMLSVNRAGQTPHDHEITAGEALAWAAHAGGDYAERAQAVIRQQADKAEKDAKAIRERVQQAVIDGAESSMAAERKALQRRAEADQLAPLGDSADG